MKYLLIFFRYLRARQSMVSGLGGLAVLCLASIPLFIVLYVVLPKRLHLSVSRRIVSISFRGYLQFLHLCCDIHTHVNEVEFDALRDEKSSIVIANHPSLLDAVILLAYVPNAVCVMKAKLLKNVLYGVGARMANYISNENPYDMVHKARQTLRDGAHLIIFPESTRTTAFPVNDFSGTAVLLAKQTDAPIQTVFFDYSTNYLGKTWGLFRPPVLPLHCQVSMGQRFVHPDKVAPFTHQIHDYYEQGLRQRQHAAPAWKEAA